VKPDKERSIERIDPIVAAIMAVGARWPSRRESMATAAAC